MCNLVLKNIFPKFLIISLLISVENVRGNDGEFFSSIAGLENLLNTEVIILTELENYISNLQQHIQILKSEVDLIRSEHHTVSEDVEGYLNNPVNAYRLIKRLHTDWHTIEQAIHDDMSRTNFLDAMAAYRRNFSFPTKEDVVGSTVALVRLQDTYKLDVSELASGILNGIKYGTSMSWQDCFLLGQHLYEIRDFNHTVPWLKQSMRMLMQQEYSTDTLSLDFMEAVVAYQQEIGDFEGALQLANHILSIESERETVLTTKFYLQQMISEGIKAGLIHQVARPPNDYHLTDEFQQYEKVCRGEATQTPSEQRQLQCHYTSNDVPFLLLQPYKMEVLNWKPYVVQYYDVLTAEQLTAVKTLAKSSISRSKVRSADGKEEVLANYRISKSAWFNYEDGEHMRKMLQRMGWLSGLNMHNAEPLQVANYGIGGHYEPHYDFFTEALTNTLEEGNRIATGIFYLSDVEAGGGTAFVNLRLLVKPKKGSVLFWYNLHSSGDPDFRTRHGACPVLKGTKWIGNIWMRERHQDRERPCGLTRGHEVSLAYRNDLS